MVGTQSQSRTFVAEVSGCLADAVVAAGLAGAFVVASVVELSAAAFAAVLLDDAFVLVVVLAGTFGAVLARGLAVAFASVFLSSSVGTSAVLALVAGALAADLVGILAAGLAGVLVKVLAGAPVAIIAGASVGVFAAVVVPSLVGVTFVVPVDAFVAAFLGELFFTSSVFLVVVFCSAFWLASSAAFAACAACRRRTRSRTEGKIFQRRERKPTWHFTTLSFASEALILHLKHLHVTGSGVLPFASKTTSSNSQQQSFYFVPELD